MTFPLGAPLLDACVLAVLEKEDAYGYSLTQRMKEVVELSESSIRCCGACSRADA